MNKIVLKSKVNSDGMLHLKLCVGQAEADKDVQVTVEPVVSAAGAEKPRMTAANLLQSGLVGIWADRVDIGDSREFARRLRAQAQTRSHSA